MDKKRIELLKERRDYAGNKLISFMDEDRIHPSEIEPILTSLNDIYELIQEIEELEYQYNTSKKVFAQEYERMEELEFKIKGWDKSGKGCAGGSV